MRSDQDFARDLDQGAGEAKLGHRLVSPSEPGTGGGLGRLETVDVIGLFEGEPDIVEPVEQAVLAEGIDIEADRAAVGTADLLIRQVDGDGGVGAALGVVLQLLQVVGADDDRQNAVLEAVVVENVGEGRRDDAADAEVEQRPGYARATSRSRNCRRLSGSSPGARPDS